MANNSLSRGIDSIQQQYATMPIEADYKAGDYELNFFSNLKDVLGETLWSTYERTNTLTGGALEKAVQDSYFKVDIDYKDYGARLERNTYTDDMKQDYKLTLSKRF